MLNSVLLVISRVLCALALIGTALSFLVHIAVIASGTAHVDGVVLPIFLGVVGVGVPTIVLMSKVTSDIKPRDLQKSIRTSSPTWLNVFSKIAGWYFIVVFVVSVYLHHDDPKQDGQMPAWWLVMASSCTMAMYSGLAGYLFLGQRRLHSPRRCPNGHPVSEHAGYCEECGSLVVAQSGRDA